MPAIRSSELLNDQKQVSQPTIHSVNIKELEKSKKAPKNRPDIWYEKLIYWVLISLAGSIIFGLLSFVDKQFLFIAPIFPLIAAISWFIRVKMKEKGLDNYHQK